MSRRAGVTLLETVVASALFSVVMGGVYLSLTQGSRGTRQGEARLQAVGDFNRVVEYLRHDARSVFWRERHPILVNDRTAATELWIDVVEGVTLQGLPIVVPVLWRFEPGGDEGGGVLIREVSPDQPNPFRKRFFDQDLESFELTKLDEDGRRLPGDDPRAPAFLECTMKHVLGDRLRVRLSLYSRYKRQGGEEDSFWLANHKLEPIAPAFPVVTVYSPGTYYFTGDRPRRQGGAVVATGAEMSLPGAALQAARR